MSEPRVPSDLTDSSVVQVRLHDVCHARTGDKGNRLNVSVIPYHTEAFGFVREQITEDKVLALFAHRGATRVQRFELPNLPAFNFVIDDVLQGGVNASLNLDGHGKTLSFLVLTLPIQVPAALTRHGQP